MRLSFYRSGGARRNLNCGSKRPRALGLRGLTRSSWPLCKPASLPSRSSRPARDPGTTRPNIQSSLALSLVLDSCRRSRLMSRLQARLDLWRCVHRRHGLKAHGLFHESQRDISQIITFALQTLECDFISYGPQKVTLKTKGKTWPPQIRKEWRIQ